MINPLHEIRYSTVGREGTEISLHSPQFSGPTIEETIIVLSSAAITPMAGRTGKSTITLSPLKAVASEAQIGSFHFCLFFSASLRNRAISNSGGALGHSVSSWLPVLGVGSRLERPRFGEEQERAMKFLGASAISGMPLHRAPARREFMSTPSAVVEAPELRPGRQPRGRSRLATPRERDCDSPPSYNERASV